VSVVQAIVYAPGGGKGPGVDVLKRGVAIVDRVLGNDCQDIHVF
jgi:hypothetical protein